MKPTFIGIGAQKCASSWLFKILEEHPEVSLSHKKELDFFSYYFANGYTWYERKIQEKIKEKSHIGEVSPSYICDPRAAKRAYNYNKQFKIIVTLRDPVKRAYSNYSHDVRLGFINSSTTFEQALELNPMYVEQSKYAKHLKSWFDVFPKENILVIFQEDIKCSPDDIIDEVYDFLKIEKNFRNDAMYQRANESYIPKNQWLENKMHSMYVFLNRYQLSWMVNFIKFSGMINLVHRYNRQKPSKLLSPMKKETIAELEKCFINENESLKKQLLLDKLPWER